MLTGSSVSDDGVLLLSAAIKESCSLCWTSWLFLALPSTCLGSDLGRNQNGIPASNITAPVTRKPSHQAPTQRESLWLIEIVSVEKKKQMFWLIWKSRQTIYISEATPFSQYDDIIAVQFNFSSVQTESVPDFLCLSEEGFTHTYFMLWTCPQLLIHCNKTFPILKNSKIH